MYRCIVTSLGGKRNSCESCRHVSLASGRSNEYVDVQAASARPRRTHQLVATWWLEIRPHPDVPLVGLGRDPWYFFSLYICVCFGSSWLVLRLVLTSAPHARFVPWVLPRGKNRLYCEEIDVGEEAPRNIASGLVPHYSLEEMKGRRVIVMCNLKVGRAGRSTPGSL